jgi:hypothetical protein
MARGTRHRPLAYLPIGLGREGMVTGAVVYLKHAMDTAYVKIDSHPVLRYVAG